MPLDTTDTTFACPDWFERLQAGRLPIPDLPLDDYLAEQAVRCFDQLRLPDVPGQPTFAEAGGEWFREIIRNLFGYVNPASVVKNEDGETDATLAERLIGELFLLVPKKNSKTTNSAALGNVALLLNTVPNARMIIIGPTQKIAETCFSQAQGMINADPKLKSILHVQEHRSRIQNVLTGAVLEIKTFDMNVLTGAIPIFVIVDELHLMSSKSYAKKVIQQLRGGMVKTNCLLVFITTQSADEPTGVFRTELFYARQVRDGKTPSENMLAVLFEFPESWQLDKEQPWSNPDNWAFVNPNIDRSVRRDWLEQELRKETAKGKENVAIWLSQHLNIQIGIGFHSDRWAGVDFWQACANPGMTLDDIIEQCEVAVVGIDGGGLDDLLGLAVIGRHKETKDWLHWAKAWVHDIALDRRKSIAERLQDFAEDGDLVICKDATTDIEEVADICEQLLLADLLPDQNAIGLDPEGVASIVDALVERDLTMDQIKAVSQGYRLNSAIKGLPRKLKNGTFRHCDQDLMAWCVGNAKTENRGNAQMITKQVSGTGKIDPLMATFNAVMHMSLNPKAAKVQPITIPAGYSVGL
ncbi:MAG: terminase large subunit [Pikeienuella sp.]